MSQKSSCGNGSEDQIPNRLQPQTSQTMSLAKTLHVQDQIIEQLRSDQAILREALDAERNALRECRVASEKEMKTLQRENIQISKTIKQQEVKIEELEKALAFAKEALACEQNNLKSLEKEHINTVKELKLKNSKDYEKSNKQEMIIDQLRSEIEDMREALESERNATNLLIKEHNTEVKMLREEVRAKSTEAYRDLRERAIRERDEYREMQEEAEKMYKILEKDFRDALAAKDEELKKVKTESRLIQKELEDQLRSYVREPTLYQNTTGSGRGGGHHDFLNDEKMRKLKSEVRLLREQNRKLLNELELLATEEKFNEIKKYYYFSPFSFQTPPGDSANVKGNESKADCQAEVLTNADRASRTEINRLLGEMRSKNRTIHNLRRDLSLSKQIIEKVRRDHNEELERIKGQCREALAMRPKPMLPIKRMKLVFENAENRRNHVRDMVRRLQEKQNAGENSNFVKIPVKNAKNSKAPEDGGNQSPNQTLEDLKAIDEDIEKLRKQIEERDKIISALREAAEAKDKKLDQMMTEYSKLQLERAEPECRTSTSGDLRVQERNMAAFSTSPSPPLCSGELCWTDGFVNKNYHEPVYAQLLSDHTALQKIYNELREKLESRKAFEIDENQNFPRKTETYENGINLIMAEQIRILKEREAQLMSEAEELREQNDLMEFRILELEECRKEEIVNLHKNRSEKGIWPERDLEDVSDSGVMSLPTSEDLTSDSELSDTFKNYLQADSAIVPTLFPKIQIGCNDSSSSDFKQRKILKSAECLQESGIFEDSETASEGGSNHSSLLSGSECSSKQTKASQTESILDRALLEIIESSCDLILTKKKSHHEDKQSAAKPDDLTTEISKLSEIQKRIQEKRGGVCESVSQRSSASQPYSCPHSNTVVFYEERLGQLEDKLKIYESSDDTKDVLLKKRLEKEIELSHRVKELSDRVANLEDINKRIEEERCEFEEAENDSRFQCQRLEIKMQELMEKNSELELELERRKMMMAGEKSEVHRKRTMVRGKKKEEGNMSMIEAAVPAILAWNIFCLNQTKNEITEHLQSDIFAIEEKDPTEMNKPIGYPDEEVFRKLEELINDQKKLRVEYEKAEEQARQREIGLKRKIEELEAKSGRDREILEEMTTYLKALKGEDSASRQSKRSESSASTEEFEMFEEFKLITENDMKMRRKIEALERKEQAYLHTLQEADEIWASMEAKYKAKLSKSEIIVQRLRNRVNELEQKETETTQLLASESTLRCEVEKRVEELTLENKQLRNHIRDLSGAELKEQVNALENENALLKDMVKSLSERVPLERKKSESLATELKVQREQGNKDRLAIEKLGKDLKERQSDLDKVEKTFQAQISDLTQEISTKNKEISNLEVTVAELREEVETLENKVAELVQALESTKFGMQDENKNASAVLVGMESRRIHQCESGRWSTSGTVSGFPSSPPKKTLEMPLVKMSRVSFGDSDKPEQVQILRDVKKIEVPSSIAKQLLRATTETSEENKSVEDRPSREIPKIKRTVLEADESFFSNAPESEVSFRISGRKFVIQEISSKTELQQPITIISSPCPKPKPLTEVYLLIPKDNPEVLLRHPSSVPKEKILVGYANRSVITQYDIPEEPSKPTVKVVEGTQTAFWKDEKEAHISELTMSNITLQKTLEKMEEESKLKDLELTTLKKVVTEIRKEQNELEDRILEMSHSFPRESKATDIDLSEIRSENWNQTDPADDSNGVKEDDDGDEQFEDVEDQMGSASSTLQTDHANADEPEEAKRPPTKMRNLNIFEFSSLFAQKAQRMSPLSNLQVALDNLPNKNRVKTAISRALVREMELKTRRHRYSDNCDILSDLGSGADPFCVDNCDVFCSSNNSLKISKQNPVMQPPKVSPREIRNGVKPHRGLKSISLDQVQKSNADIDFTAPIKVLRKIGSDSLLMEWQTDLQPSSVIGFEICVNGNLKHRVHSATRNKALLKNFDFTRKNTISLYALSAKGRSVRCTSAVLP